MLVNITKIDFLKSFTASSERFSEFDAGNVILFQIKIFGKKIKEAYLVMYFIKITAYPSFARLRIIRRINKVHQTLKWKICC